MPKGVWDRSKTKAQRQAEKLSAKTTGTGLNTGPVVNPSMVMGSKDKWSDLDSERIMYLASKNLNEIFALLHSAKTTGEAFFDQEIMKGLVSEAKAAIANYALAREKAFSSLHITKPVEVKSEPAPIQISPGIGAPYNGSDPLPFTPSALGQAFKEQKS